MGETSDNTERIHPVRCGLCRRAVQSDDDLTRCLECGRDYCDGPDCRTNTIGVCQPCSRNLVGIV